MNLEDEKVVLTSLGQPQGDFYEEEPMDPMKLVADQQTAKNLDRLLSTCSTRTCVQTGGTRGHHRT